MTMTMKNKVATMILSGTMLASGLAAAEGLDFDPKVYLGAEGQVNQFCGAKDLNIGNNVTIQKTDNKKKLFGRNGAGLSGFIGTRLNDYLGLEAGYTVMSKLKTSFNNLANLNDATNVKTKISNGYIDALGYLPICDQLEGIGSVGVGFLTTSVSGNVTGRAGTPLAAVNTPFNKKDTKAGVRLGLGLGYKFDENIGARLMVRYQQGNKHIKSITSAGLGLFYQF